MLIHASEQDTAEELLKRVQNGCTLGRHILAKHHRANANVAVQGIL
jgi:hypothetical protein